MNNPESNLESATTVDPVCGMQVSVDSEIQYQHEGVEYRFCCNGCKEKFSADPVGYLSGEIQKKAAEAEPIAGALYICPMCPEVEEDHPSSCPSCGMALEVAGAPLPTTRIE